ncbi:response regulator containing a CheY-like receiver domain and an HTH DNA-binding domain [Mycobacterium sp. JS623]|nr:LuxR family transcriptional regulator [Mycobacterium sp. JS623]AGB25647.1 response regulator containing a CheY-like receiver domain and an HTH DNA-binding domain [Mycobacterium sp. JS623]
MRRIGDAIADPDTCGVLISGSAGVGKSRIAHEAINAATAKGYAVRWVVGTSSSRAVPLGAFAAWTESTTAEHPELLQLVRGVIESLTSPAPHTPVLLAVDDVHLLDDLSTFVVQQIVQRRGAKVVLTYRHGEPVPEQIRDIWRTAPFDRLDLQPLSKTESTELVSAALGASVHPHAAQSLWELTRGNVLYLRNIVDRQVADQRLVQHDGLWRWAGDPVVPPGLVELIESLIGTLPASVSDVIDVLAVSEPLSLRALTSITDRAAVEEADVRGLIMFERLDHRVDVRLAHPLYGEVRRTRVAHTRMRRLRGLVAAELAASDDRDDIRVVVRRATLAIDSDLAPDPALLTRAAQGAVWLADMPLAEHLASAAAHAGAGVEANLVRAHALTWLSRGAEADDVLAASLRGEITKDDWGRLVFMRVQNMLFTLGDPVGAEQLIDDASHTSPMPNRACIDAIQTVYWSLTGNPVTATTSFRKLHVDELPAIVGASTAMAYCVAAGACGRTAEAVAAAGAAYAFAQRSPDAAQMRFVIADGHIGALLHAGRIADACDVAEPLLKQAADLPGSQLLSNGLAGVAAAGAGKLDKACILLEPTVNALSGTTVGWAYRYGLPYTIALAMRGLASQARDSLTALEKQRHPSWRYLDFELALANAWVAAAEGAVKEAIGTVLSAAQTARASGQFAAEVACLQAATQFGDRSPAARLHVLKTMVEGPRVAAAARFAGALHDGDPAELNGVSEDFEQMGDMVAALDATAHAALEFRRQGMRGSALGCSNRAAVIAQECGGASTPALLLAADPLPLTARQREIVALLRRGLSTKEVAQRLTLSRRTVEGHIYRAMLNTGAASRADLERMLWRHED